MSAKKKSKSKIGLVTGVIFLCIVVFAGYFTYSVVFANNINPGKEEYVLKLRSANTYQDHLITLEESGAINDFTTFLFLAKVKKFELGIKPGRYTLKPGMGNNAIINLLRSGDSKPLKVQLNQEHTLYEIAGTLGRFLEPDSLELIRYFTNADTAKYYGFDTTNLIGMFLPDTYEFYWATTPKKILGRFKSEYDLFWTDKRIQRAKAMGYTPAKVSNLASIVQKETIKRSEAPKIAGVYLNRLRIGMPLQADPTLVYASGNFSSQRVLNVYKNIDSPYNTYKYKGLPPGPIGMAAKVYLDAVLNHEKHSYLYFCAKEDFSGFSNFSASYLEHQVNARKYQKALDRKGILN